MTVRRGAGERRGRWLALAAMATGLLVVGASTGIGVRAQSTPVLPPPAEAPTIATVPAGETAPAAEVALVRLQTIAQGLVEVEGTVVWRVRQVASAAEAEPAAGVGLSLTLQREGASVVEDEASGRGALLQTGEAVFLEAGAAETRRAFGADPATVWVVELVASNARAGEGLSAGTVLYTSDLIDDYPSGEVEAELRRGVLGGGERGELPSQSGAALVIVTEGSLEVAAGGGTPASLNVGGSALVPAGTTITNAAAEPSGFVVAAIGESVEPPPAAAVDPSGTPTAAAQESDVADDPETPAAGDEGTDAAADADAAQPPAAAVAPSATDTDGDGLGDEDEAVYGSDPLNSDYDADGLLDGVEVNQYGSDPVNNDTDGDTLVDGDEVNQFLSDPASSDGDGDGIGDASEIYESGTSPSNFDTDGDGAADGDEVAVGTDPNDATSTP